MAITDATAKAVRERDLDRFWSFVNADPDGCWEWTGSKKPNGYGQFNAGGRCYVSHRWLYEALVGPIPAGMQLDHLCRNRACVRPNHLQPVTHRENQLRGRSFSAANARKTHCPKGHPLSGTNLRVRKDGPRKGKRDCRTCRMEASRAAHQRRKQQNR